MVKFNPSGLLIFILMGLVLFFCHACFGKALLPSQYKRHGLTNEQIEYIMQRNPKEKLLLSQTEWQGIRFELARYHNMTNWTDAVADKAGFSELLLKLKENADAAASTNRVLASQFKTLNDTAEQYWTQYTNETARAERLNARAEALESSRERMLEKLNKKKDEALLPSTKAIYQWMIDLFDGE